jgi:hypothetical protein
VHRQGGAMAGSSPPGATSVLSALRNGAEVRCHMHRNSLGKGRKKNVKKFHVSNGLWILGIANAILLGILVLWMLGYVHFNVD